MEMNKKPTTKYVYWLSKCVGMLKCFLYFYHWIFTFPNISIYLEIFAVKSMRANKCREDVFLLLLSFYVLTLTLVLVFLSFILLSFARFFFSYNIYIFFWYPCTRLKSNNHLNINLTILVTVDSINICIK